MKGHAITPRFYVGSVSGWKISRTNLDGRGSSRSKPTLYYVHDRLNAHRVVAEFAGDGSKRGRQRKAQRLCDKLNAEHERWLESRGYR